MRFAIVGNNRVEAKPELKEGLCPVCSNPVIAKCGKQRIHHWAHRTNKICDSWWESETEWHRLWKNNFPIDCQEVCLTDSITGERHIADVRINNTLVIEFQHSHLEQTERTAREKFYKNMIWIVDGTRLRRDSGRFLKGKQLYFKPTSKLGYFLVNSLDECFPHDWLESSMPVIFDFQGLTSSTELQDVNLKILWCLLPKRIGNSAIVMAISREKFISIISNNPNLFLNIVNNIRYTYAQPRIITMPMRNYGRLRGVPIDYIMNRQRCRRYKSRRRF